MKVNRVSSLDEESGVSNRTINSDAIFLRVELNYFCPEVH